MEKKHAIELLGIILSVTAAFLRCWWMSLFSRSRVHLGSTSLTCVHKHSKCARSVFSKRVRFSSAPHQRFPRIPRAPKARSKKNWRFCGKYCTKFTLKCRSRFHYSQILGSIPNSLFWHLEKLAQFIILRSSHSGRIQYEHSLMYPPPLIH